MNQRTLTLSLAALFGASLAQAGCGPAVKEETGKAVGPPQTIRCPDGQILEGTKCVPPPSGSTCADGQTLKDGQCVRDCPPGSHVSENGQTCTVDVAPQQSPTGPQSSAAPATSATPAATSGPCPAGMALVKGGTYKMAFLKTEATVSDVCLDITEVTTRDYEACVTGGKCNANFVDACTETTTYKKAGKEDHPMVCIDFGQAETYCKTQNKRLPTEEEWEWAGRAGSEGRLYSWGNDAPADQACWSGKKGLVRTGTCSVKEHPGSATPEGLLGMSGNVFEWTTSKNDSKGKDRVGRGGSWRDGLANLLQVGRPGRFEVTYRCGFLGVRCAVEPKK